MMTCFFVSSSSCVRIFFVFGRIRVPFFFGILAVKINRKQDRFLFLFSLVSWLELPMLKLTVQKEKELEISTSEKHPINYENHAQKNLK